MIAALKKALTWAANKVANEPVVTITTVVAGGINWAFSHFSFLPPIADTERNTIVTFVVFLTGLIVRQYVTPDRKLALAQKQEVVAVQVEEVAK